MGRNRLASSLHISEKPITCLLLSPGMKPTSHVASPLPQHTRAYLSHVVPSASHCCQKWRAGLLITCQWAWREGKSINAHRGAKRFTHELEKPASTAQMGRFAGEEGTMAAMGHQGKRWLWRRSGVLSLTLWATSRWPPALIISFVEILSHPLVYTLTAFSKGQQS